MDGNDDKKIEILSGHYSETFALLKESVEKRDRQFVYLLIVVFFILLYMNAPEVVSDLVNLFVGKQAGGDASNSIQGLIDVSFIGTVLWVGLLSLAHTYFQTVLHIERQYDYVYRLETKLSKYFDEEAFTREGKHYKEHRKKFASWTKMIYWYLFPLLLLVFVIYWLRFLFLLSNADPLYKLIDSLITLSVLISMGLYLWALHKKK